MAKKKILFLAHEMNPYLELSDNAVMVREVPTWLQKSGQEVRVFMPRFGVIKERKHRLHEVIRLSGINIPVGEDDNPLIIKVASLPSAGMQIYFLDNEDYFAQRGIFHDEDDNTFYDDNSDRVAFYNKGIMEIIHKLGWIPDVIYSVGWMGCLTALYAKTVKRNETVFENTKFIITLQKADFENSLGEGFADKALVSGQMREVLEHLDNPTIIDLYKAGITFADGIIIGNDVDPSLVEFAHQSGKPIVQQTDESNTVLAEAYYELYKNLSEDEILQSNI
ncbi:MAG: glycogen/starch synthase [Bacteroidota bacterium]|nr:glycogen/starch synthase [Bacteroidota bacterium]